MFYAELICSDEACAERVEAVGTLEELETLACECGCGLVLVRVAETGEPVEVAFELPKAA